MLFFTDHSTLSYEIFWLYEQEKEKPVWKTLQNIQFYISCSYYLNTIIFTEDTNNLLVHEPPLIVLILKLNIFKILCFDQQYQQIELSFYRTNVTLVKLSFNISNDHIN